jgi:hypothetical protein
MDKNTLILIEREKILNYLSGLYKDLKSKGFTSDETKLIIKQSTEHFNFMVE